MVETKIMKVFYDANCLPYKDKERQVHFPILGNSFTGASGTTEIRFYVDQIGDLDLTWVANAKLPNGKTGSKVLSTSGNDDDGAYVSLSLTQWFTQLKGDLYISLQGYQGGINYTYDDETDLYNISGTPIIQATGVIKINIAFSSPFNGVAELSPEDYQSLLALLGTKVGMRSRSEFVEELPEVGEQDVFYVIHNDIDDPNIANIYIWDNTNQDYIWVGNNTLDLGEYYNKQEGEEFENNIEQRVSSVENELTSVASGSPAGVYATLSDLQTAFPTGNTNIYLVSANGHWYYWSGSAWTDGGVYLSSDEYVEYTTAQDFDSLWNMGKYAFSGAALKDSTNRPKLRENSADISSGAVLLVERTTLNTTLYKSQQLLWSQGEVWYRYRYTDGTNTVTTGWTNYILDLASFAGATIYNDSSIVSRDLNNLTAGYYLFNGVARVNLSNQPSNNGVTSLGCWVKVERTTVGSWESYVLQTIYYPQTNKFYTRSKNVNSWAEWKEISNLTAVDSIKANANLIGINEYIDVEDAVDLNTLDFGVYAFATVALQNSTNTPITFTETGGAIIRVDRDSYATSGYAKQTLIYSRGGIWVRNMFNGTYGAWQKIISSDDNAPDGVPLYWNNEIDDTIDKVFNGYINFGSAASYVDTFLFLTDTHWGQNAKKSPFIINRLCKDLGIKLLLHGGDFITYESTKLKALNQLNAFFKDLDLGVKVISTIGNHDTNDVVTPSAALSYPLIYNVLFKRCEDFANTNKEIRFYYDNVSQKIRYITLRGLEGEEWSSAQKTFITDAVSSLDSSWTIVIMCHSYWQPATSGNTPTVYEGSTLNANFLLGLKATIQAKIACWLVGHVHRDISEVVTNGTKNLLIIGFNEDAYEQSAYWGGETMTLGTDTEQSINVIQINTYRKKIKITRCGAGTDREFDYD